MTIVFVADSPLGPSFGKVYHSFDEMARARCVQRHMHDDVRRRWSILILTFFVTTVTIVVLIGFQRRRGTINDRQSMRLACTRD